MFLVFKNANVSFLKFVSCPSGVFPQVNLVWVHRELQVSRVKEVRKAMKVDLDFHFLVRQGNLVFQVLVVLQEIRVIQ